MLGRQQLHMAWQEKKVHVDQLVDYNFYLRDLRQILSFYASIELSFSSQRPLQDLVKDIQEESKSHKLLGKNLELHFAKVKRLKGQAKKLTQQNHIEADSIRNSLEKLDRQIMSINAAYASREKQLELFQAKRSFYSDAEERIQWISGKIRLYNESLAGSQTKTFAERAENLKRYDTFESDIQHNARAVQDIITTGELLGVEDEDVKEKKDEVDHLWKQFQHVAFGVGKQIRLLKQKFLKEQILDDENYDANEFVEYMREAKPDVEGGDINNWKFDELVNQVQNFKSMKQQLKSCLLYTSDAADE